MDMWLYEQSAAGNSLSNTKRIDMIQLGKVIERGEQYISEGKLKWLKFADGTYLMAGRCQFTTAESNTRFVFNLTLPISLTNPGTSACAVSNIYASRRICTWSAGMTNANSLRLDVEPADATGSGVLLACSFILFGK